MLLLLTLQVGCSYNMLVVTSRATAAHRRLPLCGAATGIAAADSESKASGDADTEPTSDSEMTSRDSEAAAQQERPSPLGDAAASVASPHAEMLAAAAALRDDPVVQKLIATVSAAAPSSDESVQTMEALLQNPLVYGLVTSAGLEWCQRMLMRPRRVLSYSAGSTTLHDH